MRGCLHKQGGTVGEDRVGAAGAGGGAEREEGVGGAEESREEGAGEKDGGGEGGATPYPGKLPS